MSVTVTSALPTSATSAAPSTTSAPASSGPQSSPLLFFVALGFGVVFTNLWIIVGVKYCFRYNARNRIRQDENGDPIDLAAMPRQHRRRREKKLMTMDEVNERFPITKYKAWVSRRADEGLPTAGGVAAPQSRPGSVKNADAVVEPTSQPPEETPRPTTATSSRPKDEQKINEETRAVPSATPEQQKADTETEPPLQETKTIASTLPERTDEEMDEDDQIQMAVPNEMLANPGDSCAICIDTLEDDDDVRGLTCGHAFHASCVDPWLISRRACCPLCKADYYVPKPRTEGEIQDAERLSRRPTGQRTDSMPIPPGFALLGGRFRPRATDRNNSRPLHTPRFSRFNFGRVPRGDAAPQATSPVTPPVVSAQPATSSRPSWARRFRPSLPNFGRGQRAEPEATIGTETTTPSQLEAGAGA